MTLTENAFAVLGARPADDRMTLNEKADEVMLLSGDNVDEALHQLMQLNRRVLAELAWLPGADDGAADAFLEYAGTVSGGQPARVPPVEGLGTALAQANALSALFERWPVEDRQTFEALCRAMDSVLSQVTAEETLEAVNADRRKGSWEQVPDAMSLLEPLNERLRELCAPVRTAVERMNTDVVSGAILSLLGPGGIDAQGSVAQAMLDSYSMRVHEEAQALKDSLLPRALEMGKAASVNSGAIKSLFLNAERWCDLTAPLRLLPGAARNDGRAISLSLREALVNYVNKAGTVKQKKNFYIPVPQGMRTVTVEYQSQEPYVKEAREWMQWFKQKMPEQLELISQLEEDDKVLDQIESKEWTLLRDAENRATLQARSRS